MAAAAGPRARNCWFVWRLFLSGCLPLLRRVLGVCSFFSLFVEMAISKLRAGPTLAWPCPRLNSNSLWGGLCFESHAVRPWIRDPLEDARLITRRRLQISLFFFYSRKQRTRIEDRRGVSRCWTARSPVSMDNFGEFEFGNTRRSRRSKIEKRVRNDSTGTT